MHKKGHKNNVLELFHPNPITALSLLFEQYGQSIANLVDLPHSDLEEIQHEIHKAKHHEKERVHSFSPQEKEEYDRMIAFREKIKAGLQCLENHHISLFSNEENETLLQLPQKIENTIKNAKSEEDLDSFHLNDFLGISQQRLEVVFQFAHSLYTNKAYDDAMNVLTLLTQICPLHSNVWILLGLSAEGKEAFEAALISYSMAIILKPTDMAPYFRSIECYLAQKEYRLASDFLITTTNKVNSLPHHEREKWQQDLKNTAIKIQKHK